MPLVPYRCAPCGIELEELFFRSESPEEALPCPGCSGLAPRVHVSKFSFTGADQGYLDSMSRAHFTDAELRAGKKFNNNRQITQYEDSKGMKRMTPGTAAYKQNQEVLMDQARTIENVREESGGKGVADFITKSDIQSKYNWSDNKISKWKEMSNAAQQSYDPKRNPITPAPPGGTSGGGT